MNPALILFCRPPLARNTKTRLGHHIGHARAAMVYQSMLDDLLWKLYRYEWHPLIYLSSCMPISTTKNLYLQWGNTLSERMQRAAEEVAVRHEHLILIGSDIPFLCKSHLVQATSALQQEQTVIAPSSDGGYSLIGLHRRLLTHHPFAPLEENRQVLQATKNHLLHSQIHLLDVLDDIDTVEDLRRFMQRPDACVLSPLLFRLITSYNYPF